MIACGSAQPAPPVASRFEVSSVKPSSNCGGARERNRLSPGALSLSCWTLRSLLLMAYSETGTGSVFPIVHQVVGGPKWIDTDRFEISARAGGDPATTQMMNSMLQTLLAERFRVKTHRESRQVPVYVMTIRDASKLRRSKPGICTPGDLYDSPTFQRNNPIPICGDRKYVGGPNRRVIDHVGVTMADIAGHILPIYLARDRPVIDQTGLVGRFDLHLEFDPSDLDAGSTGRSGDAGLRQTGPSVYGAKMIPVLEQQLGLKLTASKGFVQVIMIDEVVRPSPN
jgi:uncharacterized protein (TIGR03435 family)